MHNFTARRRRDSKRNVFLYRQILPSLGRAPEYAFFDSCSLIIIFFDLIILLFDQMSAILLFDHISVINVVFDMHIEVFDFVDRHYTGPGLSGKDRADRHKASRLVRTRSRIGRASTCPEPKCHFRTAHPRQPPAGTGLAGLRQTILAR